MRPYVCIGANCEFNRSEAVLVYRAGSGGAFATLHRVKQADDEAPYLAPGELLTTAFVRTLAEGLGAQVKPEIYPENVLARTPDLLVWWSPPQQRIMFFGGPDQEGRKLNGLVFPHPALIFKVAGKDLFVRAMATTSRPGPGTPLKPLPTGTRTVEVWSAPAACACPSLPTSSRYLLSKMLTFNLSSPMPQAESSLPTILEDSSGCGEVLPVGRGSQFNT